MKVESIYREAENYETCCPLRAELVEILISAQGIKRFMGGDLPQNVVVDTVFTHTNRCVAFCDFLEIDNYLKDRIKLTMYLHDLPEVANLIALGRDHDVTSPEKRENPQLEELVATAENEVAREIFTDNEFDLYRQFEESGNYLKGKECDLNFVTEVGILATLVDKIDGNITLHYFLTEWAKCGGGLDGIFISRSFGFRQKQYEQFVNSLRLLENKVLGELGIDMLDFQNQFIERRWEGIPLSQNSAIY